MTHVGAKTVINRYKSHRTQEQSFNPFPAYYLGKKHYLILYTVRSDVSGSSTRVEQALEVQTNCNCLAMTATVRFSQIPFFLHEGDFYRALNSEEQTSEIEIPEECFCQTETVETLLDFAKLLRTTAFWGLPSIPYSLIKFCDKNKFSTYEDVIDNMCSEVAFAQDLRAVFGRKSGEILPIAIAMQIGRTEIVKYLAKDKAMTFNAIRAAAELGHIDYLVMLREHGHRWNETVSAAAARTGQLHCLKYLISNGCPSNDKVLIAALQSGHHDCIKYALSMGTLWPGNIATDLARQGNLELLQCVINHNCTLSADATTVAAEQGNLVCLRYLLENGCPTDSRACIEACRNSQLNCLQVLHTFNASWSKACTSLAARFGKLDILQYLHENSCPWNAFTTEVAVINDHVHCLRYLLENGCPYDENILNIAAVSSKTQNLCLRYLIEEHGAYLKEDGIVFAYAFTSGNLNSIQFLLDQGCPFQNCSKRMWGRCGELIQKRCGLGSGYDSMLLKCVQTAHHYQWDMIQYNTIVTNYIHANCDCLPLCSAYLTNEGIVMVPEDCEDDV